MLAYSSVKMNKFVMGISNFVVNECSTSMLSPCVDIYHLMVHDEQIEDQKLKQVCRDLKFIRPEDGNSQKTRFEVQEEVFPSKPPNTPSINNGKGYTLSLKRGKVFVPMLRSLFVLCVVDNMKESV